MKLHKEGYVTIIVAFVILLALTMGILFELPSILWLQAVIIIIPLFVYFRIIFFFRVPSRLYEEIEGAVLSSADGEIVAIEEVFENEFLKQKCIQVSVFMSPTDIHINWMPVTGKIIYFKYHPGKHLIAWHPKSSTLNERTSIGIQLKSNTDILVRQIAGALARRIVCYANIGSTLKQTEEIGFIKFGSRVDIFLPLGTQIDVKLKDLVVGGQTILARLN
ncbi:MAG: phosphatidylserine decarboxylase family protein [Bacteroidales bacterium]|nr:phosphatidylserine decarboxylase family protein [Bacteroidales bacterium]